MAEALKKKYTIRELIYDWSSPAYFQKEEMWIRARNTFKLINNYINDCYNEQSNSTSLEQLMTVLNKTRSLFINVFRNTNKNTLHRSVLNKNGEIVELDSGEVVKIDDGLRNETIIISDLFNCDEFDALELVITGEVQIRHFPFLTRGLCAVICYYDAHRFISAAVKALAEFRIDGNVPKPQELSEYLNQLLSDTAFIKRLIELLQTVNVQSELQSLHHPHINGLGGPKHQEILRELIEETLENYAQTFYLICSSWQIDSAPPFLDDLFAPLKELQPNTLFKNTHLSLWTAALILISPHNLHNMRCARDLLMEFHKKVILEDWQDSCLQASLQFAVVVSYNWLSVHQLVQEVLGGFAIKEDDLLEKAVDGLAFQFIRKCVITMPKFKESFIAIATVDTLIKNFIAHLSNQVVLLQHSGEMELQYVEEMLERGQLHRPRLHFENFIRCIADLYDGDSKYLEQLSTQFCSSESEGLVNFLRNCRQLISPVLQVAFLDMLKNICKCQESAYFIFGLLSPTKLAESALCWDHFWTAMHDYLGLFKHKKTQTSNIIHAAPSEQHDTFQQIPHAELAGLVAWVQLTEIIAKNDKTARRQFTDNSSWLCIETAVNLVTSAIPLVLKGALFRFLASIAIDEHGALKIWATLISLSVLSKTSSGKLVGIQDELETRECAFKCYDSSVGFLHLIKTLFLHAKNIDKRCLLQYLQFIVKSIICQFADRSYESVTQMWHLCSESCDALYNFLHRYVITAESVMNMEPQIIILSQILNDSPVFRSLGAVLRDGAERLQDFSPRSADHEAATLSVLRFLDVCVSLHAPLMDAIRTTNSSIIIASLDSLFLSSIERNGTAYIAIIASYLTQSELILKHVYHVVSILRELCYCQSSIQCRLVQALSPLALELIESFARLTSVKMTVIEASVLDSPVYHGIDELSMARIRGETVRLFIEMCSASIENDGTTNLAYLFCGFRMPDLVNFVIEPPGLNGTAMTCLHNLVDLLLEMTTSEAPFSLPFAALFEPTLRLILRLISINSDCSAVILRFFRSNYDLIYRLASSSLLLNTKPNSEGEEDLVLKNLKIAIQGLVLHLSAVELSSLLQNHQYNQSERYFHLMLSQRDEIMEEQNSTVESELDQIDLSYIPNKQKDEGEWPFLWKLLRTKANFNEVEIPAMELLDTKKLQHILPLCLRPTFANVQQCDIEHLNWLLCREFNMVVSEMQPKFRLGISQDAKKLLQYCATYNFMKNVEASLRQLLSGWLSFVNVLAILSPVPFLALDVQYQYLSDALYLLLNYASDTYMDGKLSSTVSHCLLRLTASICALLKSSKEEIAAFRTAITDVADVLIRFLIRPGKRSLQTKLDLYACISLILNYSTETLVSENVEHQENASYSDDDFLCSFTAFNFTEQDLLRAAFTKYGHELITLLSKDICDSPPGLRFVSLFCLTQILREDALGSQSLVFEFLRTGMLRYILESVANVNISGSETNDVRSLEHCNVVLTLFIRLGLTSCGWNGLYNVNALQILTNIPLWSNPPKHLFVASNFDLKIRNVPSMYMNYIANVVYLSIALCSNPHWKKISIQILGLLSCSADVLNHLIRTNRQYSFLVKCGMLIAHIHHFDISAQSFIEKSSCLNALRKLFVIIRMLSNSEQFEQVALLRNLLI
ncbi:Nuclear pore complex protein [Dirofilaria immitis]